MRLIVIPDIHGCYDELQLLIDKVNYNPNQDQLIFLGDYIDRGHKNLEVIQFVMKEATDNGAVALKGNHEDMLFQYLESYDDDTRRWYMGNGGKTTIKSFCKPRGVYSTKGLAKKTIRNYQEEIKFLKNLPLYYEYENFVFSHAGANWYLRDWEHSSEKDFLWGDESFYDKENETDLTFVFGHMIVSHFRKDGKRDPYVFTDGKRIALDGGCVSDGQLNAMIIEPNGEIAYEHVRNINNS